VPRTGAGNVSADPQGIENDGCGSNAGGGCDLGFNSTPLTIPVVANFTLVGTGPGVVGAGGGYGMVLRRGVGGHYVNGILARWPSAGVGYRDAQTKLRENEGVFARQPRAFGGNHGRLAVHGARGQPGFSGRPRLVAGRCGDTAYRWRGSADW
jgi:hypothetical protein